MKVCLSSSQPKSFLEKADEIKVLYKDREMIFNLVADYPEKTIILDCMTDGDLDWDELTKYNKLCRNQFIICVSRVNELRQAQTAGIRRYFGYPIETYWELNSIVAFDVEYVVLGMGLFFNMEAVKSYGVPVRTAPNLAYTDNLPHSDGILGHWILPQDLHRVYEPYIATVEFADCDIEKEQALYRIYFEQKEWRQRLDLIITNLNSEALGRLILPEFGDTRVNCGQRCLQGGRCSICKRAFHIAEQDFYQKLVNIKEKYLQK